VNAKDSVGWTALHYATFYDRIEVMKLLLEFEVEIDATDKWEETPLMKTVKSKNVNAVKLLLQRDARLDFKNNDEKTALDIAKTYRYRNETIIELLETKQNQNHANKRKRTDPEDLKSSQK